MLWPEATRPKPDAAAPGTIKPATARSTITRTRDITPRRPSSSKQRAGVAEEAAAGTTAIKTISRRTITIMTTITIRIMTPIVETGPPIALRGLDAPCWIFHTRRLYRFTRSVYQPFYSTFIHLRRYGCGALLRTSNDAYELKFLRRVFFIGIAPSS